MRLSESGQQASPLYHGLVARCSTAQARARPSPSTPLNPLRTPARRSSLLPQEAGASWFSAQRLTRLPSPGKHHCLHTLANCHSVAGRKSTVRRPCNCCITPHFSAAPGQTTRQLRALERDFPTATAHGTATITTYPRTRFPPSIDSCRPVSSSDDIQYREPTRPASTVLISSCMVTYRLSSHISIPRAFRGRPFVSIAPASRARGYRYEFGGC